MQYELGDKVSYGIPVTSAIIIAIGFDKSLPYSYFALANKGPAVNFIVCDLFLDAIFHSKGLTMSSCLSDNDLFLYKDDITIQYQSKLVTSHSSLYCKVCKDMYPYATANQVDGSLICYGCRNQ